MSFNLIDEPWIAVLDRDAVQREVSLHEALVRATEIRQLAGDSPTQDVAVLRAILAVCSRATWAPRTQSEAMDAWEGWWQDWSSMATPGTSYLERHREHFDLCHPDRPFMQVADLAPQGRLGPGLAKLVPSLGNFFTERSGTGATSLSLAEAARWLIHCHAFDDAGIKTGAAGDPSAKGGKGYPTGFPAWCGNLGLVVLEGSTLAETILLNLPQHADRDSAVWERTVGPESSRGRVPAGPADLFVWPNRRIRLHVVGREVVNAQISYGDTLTPYNMHHLEAMSAWRLSDTQTKKQGRTVYLPVEHSVDRQVWRGLAALLAKDEQQIGTLSRLAELRDAESLPAELQIGFHVVGVEYGPNRSSVASVVDDSLPAHLITLTDEHIIEVALSAVTDLRACLAPVTTLSARLAKILGGDESKAKDAAAREAYTALDERYRQWFLGLTDAASGITYRTQWHRTLRGMLRMVGRGLVERAGPRAVTGRVFDGALLDAAGAWAAFDARVTQLTPLAAPTTPPDEDADA